MVVVTGTLLRVGAGAICGRLVFWARRKHCTRLILGSSGLVNPSEAKNLLLRPSTKQQIPLPLCGIGITTFEGAQRQERATTSLLCSSWQWAWKPWSASSTKSRCGGCMSAYSECWRWRANPWIRDFDRRERNERFQHLFSSGRNATRPRLYAKYVDGPFEM
jgi:hypothetical protein